jgi:SAM-dependent methyltransferase
MGLRLNLGCGDNVLDEYVNIDLREIEGVLSADVRNLPFEDGVADEILALDILEHFPTLEIPDVLAEWYRVLSGSGTLVVRVPNLTVLARKLDTDEHDNIITNIYGGHRWGPDGAWDTHHTGWTPYSLARDAGLAGFQVGNTDLAPNMTFWLYKHQVS